MNEKTSALYSEYVIDGIQRDLTPARMLDACVAGTPAQTPAPAGPFDPVVDETIDPALKPCVTDPSEIGTYLRKVKGLRTRVFPTAFPETYTKSHIAFALIDAIWKRGHFRLDDLALDLKWTLAEPKIGECKLTARQLQAIEYMTRGLSNVDIARLGGCSETAVKKLLASTFAKLGVANRTEAVAIALRKQLVKI